MSLQNQTPPPSVARTWRTPEMLLLVLSVAMPLSFATWMALLNNFAVHRASFGGIEIGTLQSLREIPGFLAFSAVFVLLFLREQPFAYLAMMLLGLGTALTGFFPSVIGLYVTTVIMSTGFHYFETMRQSLSLQWLSKGRAPVAMGRMISMGAMASLGVFAVLWLGLEVFAIDMKWLYVIGGSLTILTVIACWIAFPRFEGQTIQNKHLVLRKAYWLYYLLTFMSGARRQIFIVFAGFLMVQKFGLDAAHIALLMLINNAISMWFAPFVGRMIGRFGERQVLSSEYIGLIVVFLSYAVVDNVWVAGGLYVVDNLFFSMMIASKTYFQKIADPADVASTSGVSFTINHIAAVVIPISFGVLWTLSPSYVFYAGAVIAVLSLGLARLVPSHPSAENISVLGRSAPQAAQ
ncbi:MFS transporter [Varunaivibrio sulfuroxidans]|uniref:MFS transporter n=1 Tax=Varunaivibrio sulfuroxidans TaxID=1773489 RepID=A0A4R3JBM7_9PROT|nr:MFS transporter [Varunaivibrio sulfuroxidans]TCS63044.1 MFS transporter [Varunaivibrio sulfuroxidans]WES31881.1 MFS transporter [Varunaivibrio sulfuroxidans]